MSGQRRQHPCLWRRPRLYRPPVPLHPYQIGQQPCLWRRPELIPATSTTTPTSDRPTATAMPTPTHTATPTRLSQATFERIPMIVEVTAEPGSNAVLVTAQQDRLCQGQYLARYIGWSYCQRRWEREQYADVQSGRPYRFGRGTGSRLWSRSCAERHTWQRRRNQSPADALDHR